jgi:hypothetical protein
MCALWGLYGSSLPLSLTAASRLGKVDSCGSLHLPKSKGSEWNWMDLIVIWSF